MKRALVHIGVPKTGTTSFQQWIYRNRAELESVRGISLYDTFTQHVRRAQIHPELLLLSQRPDHDCVAKMKIPQWSTQEWQREARAHLAARVDSDAETMMFTHEGLFLLREVDEVERLVELLAPRQLHVAVCLREPESFLRSYRAQMAKNDIPRSEDPSSSLYLEDDTWLVDWTGLLRTWRSVLGESNVTVIDYEHALDTHGSTTRPLLEAFGIDPVGLPPTDTRRANRSRNPWIDRLTERLIGRVRRLFL